MGRPLLRHRWLVESLKERRRLISRQPGRPGLVKRPPTSRQLLPPPDAAGAGLASALLERRPRSSTSPWSGLQGQPCKAEGNAAQ